MCRWPWEAAEQQQRSGWGVEGVTGEGECVTVDGECADGAGKQHSSSSVMVGELMVLLLMVNECADGPGKQHSSSSVVVDGW